MAEIKLTIDATEIWVDTGLSLKGTAAVEIEVTGGSWTANPANGMVNANGHAGLIAKPGYNLPGSVEGLLVGSVGPNIQAFAVGMNYTIPPGPTGPLLLSINDDIDRRYGTGFTDNRGSIEVILKVIT
jgi:hypothetical protein